MAKQGTAKLAKTTATIQQALALHQQGRLDEADKIYRAVLAANPYHFDALHLSGAIKHQQGRSAEALRLVAAALKAQPGSTDALANYGVILGALKRHEEALAASTRCWRNVPTMPAYITIAATP